MAPSTRRIGHWLRRLALAAAVAGAVAAARDWAIARNDRRTTTR